MKQLLLRVDDDLHRRLAEQAQVAGTSLNALASAVLGLGVNPANPTRRDRLLVRLATIGEVGRPSTNGATASRRVDRDAVLESMSGTSAIADRLINDERR